MESVDGAAAILRTHGVFSHETLALDGESCSQTKACLSVTYNRKPTKR